MKALHTLSILVVAVTVIVVAANYMRSEALILYPRTEGNTLAVITTEGPRKIYFLSEESKVVEEVVRDIDYSNEALLAAWQNESQLPQEVQIKCEISYPDAQSGIQGLSGSSISFYHRGESKVATVEISKEFYKFVAEVDTHLVIESLKRSIRTGNDPDFTEDMEMEFVIIIGGEATISP